MPKRPDYRVVSNPTGNFWESHGGAWVTDKGVQIIFGSLPVAGRDKDGNPITSVMLFPNTDDRDGGAPAPKDDDLPF